MSTATIHHVMVSMPVGGEEAARRFYGELLEFQEIEKPGNLRKRGGVWFVTGNLQLHLGVDPAFQPAQKAHVAFQVNGLDQMRGRLSRSGCETWDDEPLPGYRRFYVNDPFGNRMELIEPE
ncbi:MAG: VOC family protein [Chloroflexota bacterium]|nr:VOC family protein [Chloroflexota bacterium]